MSSVLSPPARHPCLTPDGEQCVVPLRGFPAAGRRRHRLVVRLIAGVRGPLRRRRLRGPGPPAAPLEPFPDSRRQPRRRPVCQRPGRGTSAPGTAPHRGRAPGGQHSPSAWAGRGPLRAPAPTGGPGDRPGLHDRLLWQYLGAWQAWWTASRTVWDLLSDRRTPHLCPVRSRAPSWPLWALGPGGKALPGYRWAPSGHSDDRKAPFFWGFPQIRRPSLKSPAYVTF